MAVRGINNAISQIRRLSQEAIQKMEDATEQTAREIELKAKTLAPTDLGKLGQSIRSEKVTAKKWKIVAGGLIAPYAPFVEFGTGGMVSVPEEWKEIAIKFKGAGIKQVNLRARPYMYPAYVEGRKKYLERLKAIIRRYGSNN
jgi:HK97 gp10 family phage protein